MPKDIHDREYSKCEKELYHVIRRLETIADRQEVGTPYGRENVECLHVAIALLEDISDMTDRLNTQPFEETAKNHMFQRFAKLITEKQALAERLGNADIAASTYIEVAALKSAFLALTGIPYAEYVEKGKDKIVHVFYKRRNPLPEEG